MPPFHTPDFTWNVLAVMGMISTLSLGVFGVPASYGDCLATRSSIVLTLLLTAIAFKFVFADALPKVSYQTVLDGYMNTCFFFLASVFVENALISRFGDFGDAETIDNWFALTYIALWLLANAVFVAVVRVYVLRISRILGKPLNEESEVRSPLKVQGVSMPWPHNFLKSLSRSSKSGKEEMKETYWLGDASVANLTEQINSLQREVASLKKGTPNESGTLSLIQHSWSTPPHADGGDTLVSPLDASRSSSSEERHPTSGFFSRSDGQAHDIANGYSMIQAGANFWCSVLGVTMWRTGPSSASAERRASSRPTGACTQRVPSGNRTTTLLHPTSVPVSPGSRG